MTDAPLSRWTGMLIVASLLTACGGRSPSSETAMDLDPATAAYQREGYNDLPVEARLGPHRYRIPANYFRDQIGPDFQGNFSLLVQWPDLQPLPPGKRSGQDMETFAKQITISPTYVDRVPMEGLLEKAVMSSSAPGSLEHDDPTRRLDLRDRQPEVFDLTPYRVNAGRLAAYSDALGNAYGDFTKIQPEDQDDWYLGHDNSDRLTTVIQCGSHLRPDGFVIEGDHVSRQGNRSTSCTHYFLLPDERIEFSVDYARVFLKDWKRIEENARALLTQYRAH